MRAKTISLALLVVTVGLLAYQHQLARADRSAAPPSAATASPPAVQLGVTTEPLARNWWHSWTPADLSTVANFESEAGKPAAIVMWYADWAHNAAPNLSQLRAVANRGSVPEITWEPWNAGKGLYKPQPRYRLDNIIAGRFDGYIRRWARSLAAWRHPVLLRFAQEADGNWFPWADYANTNHPGQFVRAWRHVHQIFRQAGATNVRWVWSPAFGSAEVFPGARYVDVMATTCQNAGRRVFARGWKSFADGCGKTIGRLHALQRQLPIQLAETSCAEQGGSKAAWIRQMWAYLARHREVTSLVWFNLVKEENWRIDSSKAAERAFAAGARTSRVT